MIINECVLSITLSYNNDDVTSLHGYAYVADTDMIESITIYL